MKVSELIEKLQKLPQNARVMYSENAGCVECNPEGTAMYLHVEHAEYLEVGYWPNKNHIHIVVVS